MKIQSIEKIQAIARLHPFWSKVAVGATAECWPWQGARDRDGYGYDGRDRAHRIAWEAFKRVKLKTGEVVRHAVCDNPPCCNPLHLLTGTSADNVTDRVQKERSARGAVNGRAVLSASEALSIYHSPASRNEAAKRYGVSPHTVVDIRTGRTWAWLTGHSNPTAGNTRELSAVRIASGGAKA